MAGPPSFGAVSCPLPNRRLLSARRGFARHVRISFCRQVRGTSRCAVGMVNVRRRVDCRVAAVSWQPEEGSVSVQKLRMTDEDIAAIRELGDELAERYESVENEEFLRESGVYAAELPRSIRRAVRDYRLMESSGMLVLSGLPVDDSALGPTPAHWKDDGDRATTRSHDFFFFLVSCLLGEPIGWATQQNGRIMHDIFPIKEHEHEQIGWGSDELLTWHTEDAFHPQRTDYLGLMCLRNPDGVETTAADVADVEIDDETRSLLSEERFYILPDNSHRAENQVDEEDADERVSELRRRSREYVERELENPTPVAVLFGDPDSPYLRIDPHFMQVRHGLREQHALNLIGKAIDRGMGGVVLAPGDICFIDNYRMVHGRKPFTARFDGTDRWLRRLNVTRDLRKSRALRLRPDSRVIY